MEAPARPGFVKRTQARIAAMDPMAAVRVSVLFSFAGSTVPPQSFVACVALMLYGLCGADVVWLVWR